MTTAREGEELTRVGSGTVMGALMRCYWIPALMSSELVTDNPPIRLMLLGEKLIAFRDSQGRVGVMDHHDLVVAREINVALVRIGFLRVAELKRSQRVFGSVVRSAAVRDDLDGLQRESGQDACHGKD